MKWKVQLKAESKKKKKEKKPHNALQNLSFARLFAIFPLKRYFVSIQAAILNSTFFVNNFFKWLLC